MQTKVDNFVKQKRSQDPEGSEEQLREKVEPRKVNPSELLANYACLAAAEEQVMSPAWNKAYRGVFMANKKRSTKSTNKFTVSKEPDKEVVNLAGSFRTGEKFSLNGILFEITGIHKKSMVISPVEEK
jgi:hypothetical protein